MPPAPRVLVAHPSPDLYGSDKYIKAEPICPGGGTYTVHTVGAVPACSIGGTPGDASAHVLP